MNNSPHGRHGQPSTAMKPAASERSPPSSPNTTDDTSPALEESTASGARSDGTRASTSVCNDGRRSLPLGECLTSGRASNDASDRHVRARRLMALGYRAFGLLSDGL